ISRKSMMRSTTSRCAISSRSAAPNRIACCSRPAFIFRLRPVMMLSSTLIPLKSARFWNVRAMPISATCREFMCLKVLPRNLIALGDEPAPDLARAGQLAVVGVELLVQDQEAADLAARELVVGREIGVDLLDAFADQLVDLGLLGQVGVAGVWQIASFGPVAD